MGKFGEEEVGVGLGNDAGSGVNVGGASNAPSVGEGNAAVDTAFDTVGRGLSTKLLVLIIVGSLIAIVFVVALSKIIHTKVNEYKNYDSGVEFDEENVPSSDEKKNDEGKNIEDLDEEGDKNPTSEQSTSPKAKAPIFKNILFGKNANSDLVTKIKKLLIKIYKKDDLTSEDVTGIESTNVNSDLIKKRALFDIWGKSKLADEIVTLAGAIKNNENNNQQAAVENFRKNTGIKTKP